jgi:hypothetical protein
LIVEMKNVRIAFEEYDGNLEELIGYEEITGHLVFDVKLGENFRRTASYCADGHNELMLDVHPGYLLKFHDLNKCLTPH